MGNHGTSPSSIARIISVADPGFPVGGVDLVGGHGLLRGLHFENFICQNEDP